MRSLLILFLLVLPCGAFAETITDPSGASFPANYEHGKQIRYIYTDDVERACAQARKEDSALAGQPTWSIYACTIGPGSPSPIIVIPKKISAKMISCGWTIGLLKLHEIGHVHTQDYPKGATKHGHSPRKAGC